MEEKISREELSKKISEISSINDSDTINQIINLCLKYRHQRVADIKNDIGTATKIAETLFSILRVSMYGSYMELNENYILLANHYKNYHNTLKNQISSDFDIDDPLWIRSGHLKAVYNYFHSDDTWSSPYDLLLTEESLLHDLVRLNLIHGTQTPTPPREISLLLEKTNQDISTFLHDKLTNSNESSSFKEFKDLIYMPEYYELTLNINNQICLNGAPISTIKTQPLSNADKIIDTIFDKDNDNKFFSFNIATNKPLSSYFNHIGLTTEYRAVFFPNSKLSVNQIFFRSFVKRNEITDPEILIKFDSLLKKTISPPLLSKRNPVVKVCSI